MSTVKEKSKCCVIQGLKPVAHLLKTWYLNVGYDYINSKKLSQVEEDVLEDISNYYLEAIKDLVQN